MKSQLTIVHDDPKQNSLQINRQGIVLLFPVTRIGEHAINKWNQLVLLCNKSKITSLVVIDKTANREALNFFSNQEFIGNFDIWILIRPASEAIYDSQKYIKLNEKSWIIQLHDDDEWDGSLELKNVTNDQVAFQFPFFVGTKVEHRSNYLFDNLPSRINFTLIPSFVWNRFTNFIEAQSGHIAGSADATLNMVVRDICVISNLDDFCYFYNIRHWKDDKLSRIHLTELSKSDGWGTFSSPEIAVINRTLDNLAALSFFSDLYGEEKILEGIQREIKAFRLRKFKWLLLKLQSYTAVIGVRKERRMLVLQLLMCSKNKSVEDVILWLNQLPALPHLNKRVEFWIKEITKLQGLNHA